MITNPKRFKFLRRSGITLVEVLMSLAIGGVIMAGTVNGFIQSMRRAEWSAHCLAANSLALQRLEQTRAGTWDRLGYPVVDDIVNARFPVDVQILDVPMSHDKLQYATNYTTIAMVSTNPPLKMIRVDCTWKFVNGETFTNTIVTYRAPNQ